MLALIVLTIIGGFTANFLGAACSALPIALSGKCRWSARSTPRSSRYFRPPCAKTTSFRKSRYRISAPGLHAIAFVTKTADIRVNEATGEEMISVFLPTTPNPTSGFLLFVPKAEIKILDMTVEEGARLVISAGLADKEASSS